MSITTIIEVDETESGAEEIVLFDDCYYDCFMFQYCIVNSLSRHFVRQKKIGWFTIIISLTHRVDWYPKYIVHMVAIFTYLRKRHVPVDAWY